MTAGVCYPEVFNTTGQGAFCGSTFLAPTSALLSIAPTNALLSIALTILAVIF